MFTNINKKITAEIHLKFYSKIDLELSNKFKVPYIATVAIQIILINLK